MTGYAGSDSWGVGCGLENFCAQGGVPGCAFCYLQYGHFITGFNSMTVGAATTISGPGVDVVGLGTDCIGCCAMFYGCSGSGYLVLTVTSVVPTVDIGTSIMFLILAVWLTSVVDTLLCRTVVTHAATVLFREKQVVRFSSVVLDLDLVATDMSLVWVA
jgi:hypothetical protein